MADSILALTDQTITLTRGQTYNSGTLSVTEADGTTPVDLTGADIIFTVKQQDNGAILIRKSVSGGSITEIDEVAGTYSFQVADSDTNGWNPNTYFYDIVIKDVPNSGETWYHIKRSKFTVRSSTYVDGDTHLQLNSVVDINTALVNSGVNQLDGDKVDIDWNPTNYTPEDVAETDDTDDLSAHLKGIDVALGSIVAGSGTDLTGLGTNETLARWDGTDTLQDSGWTLSDADLLTAGGVLAMGANAITTSSTVDGRDVATDGTKLDGIEALADVTDAANVTAAGAVMYSPGLSQDLDCNTHGLNVDAVTVIQPSTNLYAEGAGSAALQIDSSVSTGFNKPVTLIPNGPDADYDLWIFSKGDGQIIVNSHDIAITGHNDGEFALSNLDSISMQERADHLHSPAAGYGLVWVRNDAPCRLYFTDDAGTDIGLAAAGIFIGSDEVVKFTDVASAVNEITIANAATGNPPSLKATGETNVSLVLDASGTGTVHCTQAAGSAKVTLSDGANIATDASLGNVFEVTLEGSRTLDNPTNLVSGYTYVWIIKQDGSGNHTLDYGTDFWFNNGTAPVVPTAASAIMVVTGVYDGTRLLCSFDGEDGFATT